MCSWSNKGNHLSNEACIALCSVNVGSALLLLLDKVSVCYRCCQIYQCVIAVELARYHVVSLLSKTKRSGIAIKLARYQCVIAVVRRSACCRDSIGKVSVRYRCCQEISVLSRLNWQGISVLSLLSRSSACYRD